MADASGSQDELANLKLVVKDDEKIITPARWMPRVELACADKRCLLLGGHRAATNTIMVWCTCGVRDSDHPDGSRQMSLDAWVVEHCRGEDLSSYDNEEDEDEEDEQSDPVDELCMEEARVVRVGANVLPKQIPLRQLLSQTLVAQGGNKELKGASFWVYWYDQPIPTPGSREYAGLGRSWAPGPLARRELGVWYRARVTKCDTETGVIKVKYDVDASEDALYLLVAFAHFAAESPSRGSRPDMLPDMDLEPFLGLPPSAVAAGGSKGSKGSKAAGSKAKASAAATVTAKPTKPPSKSAQAPAAATKPSASPAAATVPPPAKAAAAAAKRTETATPAAAAAAPTATPPTIKPPTSKSKPSTAAAAAAAAPPPQPLAREDQPLKSRKRASSPPPASTRATSTSAAATKPAKANAAAAAAAAAAQQVTRTATKVAAPAGPPSVSDGAAGAATGGVHAGTGAGAVSGKQLLQLQKVQQPPAKRPRHEFDPIPLASAHPATAPAAAPSPASAASLEAAARARPGFCGLLSGNQEQVPVFAFNEVDTARPPAFEYVGWREFEARLAGQLAEAGGRQPAVAAAVEELRALCAAANPQWGVPCGRSYHAAVRQREERERERKQQQQQQQQGGQQLQQQAAGDASGASCCCYGPDGRLLSTRPLGVHECSSDCCCSASQSQPQQPLQQRPQQQPQQPHPGSCLANMRLPHGVTLPLEVFRTSRGRERGWALRCSRDIAPGELVAPVLGELVPAAAVLLAGSGEGEGGGRGGGAGAGVAAPGVVLLDHFFVLWDAVYTRGLNWCDRHVKLWQLPPNPLAHALRDGTNNRHNYQHTSSSGSSNMYGRSATMPASPADAAGPSVRRLSCMLAIDTRRVGNVARFVRQWTPSPAAAAATASGDLGPALVAQPVLAGSCRSPLLYYIGLFAVRHVAAGEELTCDWSGLAVGASNGGGGGGQANGRWELRGMDGSGRQ